MDDIFEIYYKPWSRIGSYVVGVFTGYLLYRTECKITIPKFLNFVGWTLATVLAIYVLYGLYTPDGSIDKLCTDISALYNATSRIAWSVCVAWIYRFLGHMCVTYAAAFILSLAFESPMIGLEKVLLGRRKK